MAWMVNSNTNNSGGSSGSVLLLGPTVFRSDSSASTMDHHKLEKRQLFLRSYQFSRKKSLKEKIRRSFMRVKRVIWFRLRSARRFRKLVCSKLSKLRLSSNGGFGYGKRKSSRFLNLNLLSSINHHDHHRTHHPYDDKNSSYLW